MLLNLHPQTGILLLKKTTNYPTNSYTPDQVTAATLFNGFAVVDDETHQSTVALTSYGITRPEGYIIYIDKDELDAANIKINKRDFQFLEVRINPDQLHAEVAYSASNNDLVLDIVAVTQTNSIMLNHIQLTCELAT